MHRTGIHSCEPQKCQDQEIKLQIRLSRRERRLYKNNMNHQGFLRRDVSEVKNEIKKIRALLKEGEFGRIRKDY